jgi:hypothetical protein
MGYKTSCKKCEFEDFSITQDPCKSCWRDANGSQSQFVAKDKEPFVRVNKLTDTEGLQIQLEEVMYENAMLRRDMDILRKDYQELLPLLREKRERDKLHAMEIERQQLIKEMQEKQYREELKMQRIEKRMLHKRIEDMLDNL